MSKIKKEIIEAKGFSIGVYMEFASQISPDFKLYIIQDWKRLKSDENSKLSLSWNLHREFSKINYRIHTAAIKTYLLTDLTSEQLSYKYASEADILNVALFNKRAKQWREENPGSKGNIRDYASLNELLVLSNMESYNAVCNSGIYYSGTKAFTIILIGENKITTTIKSENRG